MKIRIFTFFILFFFALQNQAQVTVDYSLMTTLTKEEIQTELNNQGAPFITTLYDVDVYKVSYTTPNVWNTGTTTATGAIAYPKGYLCNVPMASYSHGTTSSRTGVPSYNSNEVFIGVLYASLGYAVSMADLLGLGDDYSSFHPYVHAKSAATATIDIIRASQEIAEDLDVNLSEQLFLFGYSQGGHSTVAAFKEIQENHSSEFTVTACAGMSGPYDLEGAQTDYVNAGVPYNSPGYLPYLFLGYQEAYGNLYTSSISEVLVAPYDTTIPPLFDGTNGFGYINSQCTPIPTDMVVPSYQAAFEADASHPFRVALEENTLMDWVPQSPLRLLYCGEDEQVTGQNAINAAAYYNANGAPDVAAEELSSTADHNGCVSLCLVRFKFFTDDFVENPSVYLDDAVLLDESDAGAMDGAITLVENADAGTLTYAWSNGDMDNVLDNVSGGNYTVTITNTDGCSADFTFDLQTTVSNNNLVRNELAMFPNPVSDILHFDLESGNDYQVELMDISGRKIFQGQLNSSLTMDMSSYNDGLYFVSIMNEDASERFVGKVMKK
ncbi:MAG: T9SS type A sorting domain-containing protein [Saprospiraceae bacterium]